MRPGKNAFMRLPQRRAWTRPARGHSSSRRSRGQRDTTRSAGTRGSPGYRTWRLAAASRGTRGMIIYSCGPPRAFFSTVAILAQVCACPLQTCDGCTMAGVASSDSGSAGSFGWLVCDLVWLWSLRGDFLCHPRRREVLVQTVARCGRRLKQDCFPASSAAAAADTDDQEQQQPPPPPPPPPLGETAAAPAPTAEGSEVADPIKPSSTANPGK